MKLSVGQRFKALFTGRVDVQPPERVIERVPPNVMGSWNGYTLSLWQGCNKHIEWMQAMMADHYFRDMLAVLTNATPSFKQESLDPTSASVALGKFWGCGIHSQSSICWPGIQRLHDPRLRLTTMQTTKSL
jgi:hypothetical protein